MSEKIQQLLAYEREARENAERLLIERNNELLNSQKRLALALWASKESIWVMDVQAKTYEVTRFFKDGSKHIYEESIEHLLQRVHPSDISLIHRTFNQLTDTKGEVLEVAFRQFFENDWRWIRLRGQPSELAADGTIHVVLGTAKDITEQQRQVEKLDRLARFDQLTGLLNRHVIQNALDTMLTNNKHVAVLFVDLDGFKLLNDSLGHATGDTYLQNVAETLRKTLPNNALIARYGGDEFVCAMPLESADSWQSAVQDLIDVNTPFAMPKHTRISVTGSIGVALYPAHGESAEELIEHADTAMYEAKRQGKDRYALYDPVLTQEFRTTLSMLSELKQALANRDLIFHAQPKVNADGHIMGAELLCRWTSQNFGSVSPAVFIPLIEKHGLSQQLSRYAIESAVLLAKKLKSTKQPLLLAVNITVNELQNGGFLREMRDFCLSHGVACSQIELEVTESIFIEDSFAAEQHLQLARDLGFSLSMDDFGTGYSSLSYMANYQFDAIKIDQSFVKNLLTSPRAELLISAIVSLCKTLNMRIIAEGVESKEQFERLIAMGVHRYQGFYLGRPIPQSELVDLVLSEVKDESLPEFN